MAGQKSFFDWVDAFFFYFEFSIFSKFIFDFFLMIGSRYLNRMGSIRKRIKIPIFSKKKKKISQKRVFFLKAYNLKTNRSIFLRNHGNAEYK